MDKAQLIHKILSGTASDAEKLEFEKWLAQGGGNKAEYENLKLLWENTGKSEAKHSEDFGPISKIIRHKLSRKTRAKNAIAVVNIALLVTAIVLWMCYWFLVPVNTSYRFDKVPLQTVIESMEENYNVKIKFERNELSKCYVTASFYKTEKMEDILDALCQALNLKHQALGNNMYVITGEGCLK